MTAAVGASVMASESQPCRGKTGTLTAKAKRKASEASQSAAEVLEEMAVLRRRGALQGAGRSKVPVGGVDPEDADEQDGGRDEGVEEVA